MPKAPRVQDVAQLAGVSVGTVSNVLNKRVTVRPEIKKRVDKAISQLGYVPNPTARALRRGVSPLVGVAILDIANPFFMEAARGMEKRLDMSGCVMALSATHSDVEEEARLLRTLAAEAVRGILLTPTDPNLVVAGEVASRGVPVVLFDSPSDNPAMSSIAIDDRLGARQATEHLLNLGHRRILVLNGPARVRQARDRLAGVHDAVGVVNSPRATAGDSVDSPVSLTVVELDSFKADASRSAMQKLLNNSGIHTPSGADVIAAPNGTLNPPDLPDSFPTGIICASDLIAFGAMTALRDAGVRIPADVSLVGFDDIPMAAQMSVPLTTIQQPMETLGWRAVDLLLDDSTQICHHTIQPTLVVRASTGRPRPLTDRQ